MSDVKIESLVRSRPGMQPCISWTDVRVTHLQTGLVVEVPHEFSRSQHRNIAVAISMIESAVKNGNYQQDEEKIRELERELDRLRLIIYGKKLCIDQLEAVTKKGKDRE